MSGSAIYIGRDALIDPLLARIGEHFSALGHTVRFGPAPQPGVKQVFDREHYGEAFVDVEVALLSSRVRIANDLLESSPRLHTVVAPTIGMECIDVAAATRLGILVANGATEENFISMAESTVMWILTALYRPQWSEQVLRGERDRPAALPELRWARTLQGRTVGLAGYGQIGRRVVERLLPFGVRIILAEHPSLDAATLPQDVQVVPLETLLTESDIVSLHANARAGQRHLISATELALMKPDAWLINTARGSLVDEQALAQALSQRTIGGAALDTFEVEPLPSGSPLRGLDNVILTPHLVGHTQEMFLSLQTAAVANIHDALAGHVPELSVNPQVAEIWRALRSDP